MISPSGKRCHFKEIFEELTWLESSGLGSDCLLYVQVPPRHYFMGILKAILKQPRWIDNIVVYLLRVSENKDLYQNSQGRIVLAKRTQTHRGRFPGTCLEFRGMFRSANPDGFSSIEKRKEKLGINVALIAIPFPQEIRGTPCSFQAWDAQQWLLSILVKLLRLF